LQNLYSSNSSSSKVHSKAAESDQYIPRMNKVVAESFYALSSRTSPHHRSKPTMPQSSESMDKEEVSRSTLTDEWDPQLIGDRMELREDRVTFTGGRGRKIQTGNTAFMSRIVDRGVHSWCFEVDLRFSHWWSTTIGIWRCSNDSTPPRNDIFTLGEHRGYGFNPSEGTLVDPATGKVPIALPMNYGQRCIRVNVVEMVLDLDRLELKYIINGRDFGKAFSVEKGAYRAAVNLSQIGDSVQLLSSE